MDCTQTIYTADVGTLCMALNAPIQLTIPVTPHTTLDIDGKFVSFLLSKADDSPVVFSATSAGAYITIVDGGTATQKITISIPTSAESAHSSSVTLASLQKPDEEYKFAVNVSESDGADIDFRIQGAIHYLSPRGTLS